MSRPFAGAFAGWRTGLSGPVIVLQAGSALNSFGYGLILPFEIIYLHQARGFSTAIAGLVLATTMGTAAVVTPPSGALLDRFRAKPILIFGSLASGFGYAAFAFIDRPWQAFFCSAVAGAGLGVTGTANRVLSLALVTAEQRASLFALGRVGANFGIGSGATVAGFIVASVQHLRAFQTLYVFDALTCAAFALIVLIAIPNPRLANAAAPSGSGTGFRAVARDRIFVILIAANIVLLVLGPALFANILPPFATAHTPVGPGEIGILFLLNTFFIVVAQIPATRVVKRMRRTHAFAATGALFAVGLLAVLLATLTRSTLDATTVLAGVAIVIAIGECVQSALLGPVVAELAPPHLLGRYMSLYSLTFMAALALGPAVGGAVLATSPDAVWWGGAVIGVLIGVGLLRLGNRMPDPLLQTQSAPPRAAPGGDVRRRQTGGILEHAPRSAVLCAPSNGPERGEAAAACLVPHADGLRGGVDVFEGFTLEHVDLGEVTLRARHGGDGPPMVLVPGADAHNLLPDSTAAGPGSLFIACPDLHADDLRNDWEVSMQNYDIRYDDKYGQLAQIDVAAEGEGYEPWVNQTLTSVNDCVVRLAVIEGELVDWHSHDHEDEFFLVLEGRLELEVQGRDPFFLGVHQGVTIPRGVVHRPRAHGRTVLLMVEPATVIPTGND